MEKELEYTSILSWMIVINIYEKLGLTAQLDYTSNLGGKKMSVVMCRMECKVDGNGLSHYIIYDEQGELPF